MKPIALSHDSSITVYMVPDKIADKLQKYCLQFCNDWLNNDPAASKYRIPLKNGYGLCYDGDAFIDYLNTSISPNQPSYILERLEDVWFNDKLPEKYRDIPHFNF